MSKHPAIPPLHAVKSSSASQIGHAHGALFVRFKSNGQLYRYDGVSGAQFAALQGAESVGKHLQAHIFAKFKGVPVAEPDGA
jgi:hypothetical protein